MYHKRGIFAYEFYTTNLMKKIYTLIALSCMISSCMHDPIVDLDVQLEKRLSTVAATGSTQYFVFPESGDLNAIPNQEITNPITSEKVKLGKLLFYETGLGQHPNDPSAIETYSCSSCHIPSAGFTPGRMQGIADGALGFGRGRQVSTIYSGDEVDAQGARPLSVLHSAYTTNALWSGGFGAKGVNEGTEGVWNNDPAFTVNFNGFEGLESQNMEALELHRMEINNKVLDEYGYRELYDQAFPEYSESERYSEKATSFAISAYLRTLYADEAPFQSWLKGDKNAITDAQKRGAILFMDKAGCYKCHNGPAFSNTSFFALGVSDLYELPGIVNTSSTDKRNLGRGGFTGNAEDNYKFKVPQLYNLKNYSNYFHGSSKETLEEVVEYKLAAVSENQNVQDSDLSPLFRPVNLSDEEKSDLLSFLKEALYDPNLNRYMPDETLSGNCFPNNDAASRSILGCD